MKDKPLFAVVYMFVVTAFFSSVLIGFARLTRDKVEMNRQLAFEKAVLQVFPEITAASNAEVHRIFSEQFELSSGGYLYRKDGLIKGYAVPVEGKGYWATIKGIIGIAADKQTVSGIAIYEQNETPGLGGRIVEEDFRDAFVGLQLNRSQEPIGIKQVGLPLMDNQVHSITGATQTCVRLEKLVNEGLVLWQKENEQRETD